MRDGETMTDHTTEGGGPPLSFKKVPRPAIRTRPGAARPRSGTPAAESRVRDDPARAGAPHHRLPRRSRCHPGAHRRCARGDARSWTTATRLRGGARVGATGPRPGIQAPSVRSSSRVGARRRRPADVHRGTGAYGRPAKAEQVVSPDSVPGGKGWNIRSHDDEHLPAAAPRRARPGGRPRTTPAMTEDRSAWDVPAAPRSRRPSGAGVHRHRCSRLLLVAILGFAAFEWSHGPERTPTTHQDPGDGRHAAPRSARRPRPQSRSR